MTQPIPLSRSKHTPFCPKGPFSHFLTSLRLILYPKRSLEGLDSASSATDVFDQLEPFLPEVDRSLRVGHPGVVLYEHLANLVRCLRPLLPGCCEWLERGALEVIGEHPVDAGGVADVWVGEMGNRKVAIKAYRCDSSSDFFPTYTVSDTCP